MAQKILGYVNLIWKCQFCNTENPGAIKSCTSCGAPQPPEVKFEEVDTEKFDFIKDEALIRMAKSGPDKHCPYCGTRNLADSTRCVQCGSDITVGASQRESGQKIDESNLLPTTVPSPPKKLSKGCMVALILGVTILCIISILFLIRMNKTETITAEVDSVSWTRQIEILTYSQVQKKGWDDEIPANSQIGYCSQEYRYTSNSFVANATEVCGEPYTVDTGTGIGEVRQDCTYEVYDDYCEYAYFDWVISDVIEMTGYDLEPMWPSKGLTSTEKYGNQQELYKIVFNVSGDQLTFSTTDINLFQQAIPGSNWELEINGFGDIIDINPY